MVVVNNVAIFLLIILLFFVLSVRLFKALQLWPSPRWTIFHLIIWSCLIFEKLAWRFIYVKQMRALNDRKDFNCCSVEQLTLIDIAHISHTCHDRGWCTFFKTVPPLASKTLNFGPFWPLLAFLSQIKAHFGAPFPGPISLVVPRNLQIWGMLINSAYFRLFRTRGRSNSPFCRTSGWSDWLKNLCLMFVSISQINSCCLVVLEVLHSYFSGAEKFL